MKTIFVSDLYPDKEASLYGWVKRKRSQKNCIFLDVIDSTGQIQVVVDKSKVSEQEFVLASGITKESAVCIKGQVVENGTKYELIADSFSIVSRSKTLSPSPRDDIDIFDPRLADLLLKNRHLYLRNPKIMAILRYRSDIVGAVSQWFRDNKFVELDAPVLTALPLYNDNTAIPIQVHDESVFLTQCVGYYLESAVHAFERVYNLGPSFRAEESRSKRHLMEYHHIKAELTFVDLNDLMMLVESLLGYVTQYSLNHSQDIVKTLGTEICTDALKVPFPRITYREAVEYLEKAGRQFEFGKSLGSEEEEFLSQQFDGPFWIVGIPRSIEPFPYVIDHDDQLVTKTADLIASRGYGELLGVAEKIPDLAQLDERMKEKGRYGDPKFNWIREMREVGFVPHGGFGMGLERMIRWLLLIPHVRDAIPFPRVFRRKIHP